MALKQVPTLHQTELRPLKLWLDDLEDVYEILREDGGDVRIEADGYQATEVKELTELRSDRLNEVKLSRLVDNIGRVTVELRRHRQVISVWKPDNESLGVAHRVTEVLKRRRRPLTRVVSREILYAFAGLSVPGGTLLAVASVVASFTNDEFADRGVGVVLGLAGAILATVGATLYRFDRTIIIARRRADSPGFFQRNRDQIGMTVVSSVISGVVGFILGRLS